MIHQRKTLQFLKTKGEKCSCLTLASGNEEKQATSRTNPVLVESASPLAEKQA